MDADPASTGSLYYSAYSAAAVVSILVFAFRSACLSSFLSLNPSTISPFAEEDEPPNVDRVRALLRRATLTMVSFTSAGFIAFAAALLAVFLIIYRATHLAAVESLWVRWPACLLILAALAVFIMFLGHTVPVMQFSSPDFILKNALAAQLLAGLMYPASVLMVWLANLLGRPEAIPRALGVEDFAVYSATAPVEDDLEEEEREMISAIVELGETTVREIMTPRIDIVALDADDPPEENIAKVLEAPFSRFPVYAETIDNIIGVLHIRDLMVELKRNRGRVNIRALAQEPVFVPETKNIDELLADLRRRRRHLAIVTDEYGGTAGLVTIEDIIEEIVGEIQDEYDDEAQPIYRKEDGSFVVNAGLPLEEFNEELGLALEGEGSDTVGGLLYSKFGRIPRKGDAIHINGVKFTVLSVDRNRIKLVRVELRPR